MWTNLKLQTYALFAHVDIGMYTVAYIVDVDKTKPIIWWKLILKTVNLLLCSFETDSAFY